MEKKNEELYNYLCNNFSVCNVIENGGYYAQDSGGNEFFFSNDCTVDNINLVSYYPGIGGSNTDAAVLRNELLSEGVSSNQVVAIARNYHDSNNILGTFDQVASDVGIDVSGLAVVNFSGSTPTAFEKTNNYLASHPEIQNASMIVADGYYTEDMLNNEIKYDTLIGRQVPITFAGPVGDGGRVRTLTTEFGDLGYNTFYMQENTMSGHIGTNNAILEDGFLDYMLGDTDTINNASRYTLEKYDNENHVFDTDNISLDDMCFNNYKIDIDALMGADQDFHLQEVPSEYAEKYAHLSSLEEKRISYISDSSSANSNAITSNLTYIENFANSLISSIKAENMSNLTKLQTSAACGPLLNIIGKYMGSYYDSVGTLLNSLSLEADAIISIGQAMADMDMYLRNVALDEIDDAEISASNSDASSVETAVGGAGIGGSIAAGSTSSSGGVSGNNSSQSSNSSNEGVSSNNSNQSSNSSSSDMSNSESTGSASKEDNQVVNSSENIPKLDNNVNENTSVIYEKEDYKVIADFEDGNVVSMKYLYECGSNEDASKCYELLMSKYGSESYIENIVLTDNGVEMIFKSSVIENNEIDSLLEKYNIEGIDY